MPPTTDSINVFVTGFGPFPKFDGRGGIFERNAAHLVTQLLPPSLPPSHPLNPTARHINIVNPTAAEGQYVKTEYAYIRKYISDLHDAHKEDVDLFLHIGMAYGWDFVAIERRAYKQGFSWGWGSDGEARQYYMLEDAKGQNVLSAPVHSWASKVPMGLMGTLGVDAMVAGANKLLAKKAAAEEGVTDDEDKDMVVVSKSSGNGEGTTKSLLVKPDEDSGYYCCGFIHYESMANKYVKGTRGHVMFCHVPGETDKVSLEKARNSIVAIIGAAVGELLEAQKEEEFML